MTLYLSEADVEQLLSPEDAVAAIEACFERMARGAVENRPRYRLDLDGGKLAVMAASDLELGFAGAKVYSGFRDGARRQAESHVACIRAALPAVEHVVAYCRTRESLDAFCTKVGAEAGESHRDAAAQDVVVTATTSPDPVLRGEWLAPGALVCAIGANDGRRRELDNVVLERATFVCCDSVEDARLESADLIEPVGAGVLDWLEVHELQEVVAGELRGRAADSDIVLFKSNGLAAWDVAAAAAVLERARGTGSGREL